MYTGLLLILGALFAGYCIRIHSRSLQLVLRRFSSAMLYLILFLMGFGLALVEDLGSNLLAMLQQTLFLVGALLIANLGCLYLIGRYLAMPSPHSETAGQSKGASLAEPLRLIATVGVGLLLGLLHGQALPAQSAIAEWALVALVFAIGIDLRAAGISLRQLLLNRRGLLIALTVVVSSMPVGLAAAWYFELPWAAGLAMTSGYGWYSLSGALIGDGLNPVLGSTAFMVDMGRELLTLLLIPVLMTRSPAAIIGYAGATAMDFSLPMLQRAGGNQIVPVAIASGFILSLLCPLLVLFWLGLV